MANSTDNSNDNARRIELLKRKKELLLQTAQVPQSAMGKINKGLTSAYEMAGANLIPKQGIAKDAVQSALNLSPAFVPGGKTSAKPFLESGKTRAISGMAAGLAVPSIMAGGATLATVAPPLMGLAGGAGGATLGGMLTPEYPAIGATVGGLLGGAAGYKLGGIKPIQRFSEAGKQIKAIPAQIDKLNKDISRLQESKISGKQLLTEKKAFGLQALQEKAKNLKDIIKGKSESAKIMGKEQLSQEAGMAAEQMQKEILRINKEASNKYGERLDSITSKISKTAQKASRKDTAMALGEATKKIEQELLEVPPAVAKLLEKYSASTKMGETGKFERNNIPIEEIITDIKNLRKGLSTNLKTGQRFMQDDLPIEYAAQHMIDVVNKATKGAYAELQGQYAPIMKLKKSVGTIFKPFQGETGTKPGAGFLTRVSRPGASTAETKIYEQLTTPKTGKDFFTPARDVTGGIKQTESLTKNKLAGLSKRGRKIDTARQTEGIKFSQKIDRARTQFSTKLNDAILSKKTTLKELETSLKSAEDFRKWATISGVGTAILGLGFNKAKKLIGSLLGGEGAE